MGLGNGLVWDGDGGTPRCLCADDGPATDCSEDEVVRLELVRRLMLVGDEVDEELGGGGAYTWVVCSRTHSAVLCRLSTRLLLCSESIFVLLRMLRRAASAGRWKGRGGGGRVLRSPSRSGGYLYLRASRERGLALCSLTRGQSLGCSTT